jgi:hypothetical protein
LPYLERNAPKWNHFGEAIPLQVIDDDQLLWLLTVPSKAMLIWCISKQSQMTAGGNHVDHPI